VLDGVCRREVSLTGRHYMSKQAKKGRGLVDEGMEGDCRSAPRGKNKEREPQLSNRLA